MSAIKSQENASSKTDISELEAKAAELRSALKEKHDGVVWLLARLVEVSSRLHDYYSEKEDSRVHDLDKLTSQDLKTIYYSAIENKELNKNDRALIKQLIKYWESIIENDRSKISRARLVSKQIASLINEKRYDEALSELDAFYRLNKTQNNKIQTIEALRDIGLVLKEKGDLLGALDYFKMAAQNNPIYFFEVGYILFLMDRFKESSQAYEKLLRIAPKNKYAWNNAGWAFLNIKNNAKALQCFNKAIELGLTDWQPLSGKGIVLRRMGKFAQALKITHEALRLHPDNPPLLSNITLLYSDCLLNNEKALYYAKRAVEIAPDYINSKPNLAEILVKIGRYQEGRLISAEVLEHTDNLRVTMPLHLIISCSYYFENNVSLGAFYLNKFHLIYNNLPKDFQSNWDFNGLKSIVSNRAALSKEIKIKLMRAFGLIEKLPEI